MGKRNELALLVVCVRQKSEEGTGYGGLQIVHAGKNEDGRCCGIQIVKKASSLEKCYAGREGRDDAKRNGR